MAFSPDGTKIVSGSLDKTIIVWDTGIAASLQNRPSSSKTDDCWLCLTGVLGLLSERTSAHSDWVTELAFSPDGTKIVSVSHDRTIKVWDSGAPECVSFTAPSETDACPACQAGALKLLGENIYAHPGYMIMSVAFSPDGAKIVSGSTSDGTINVWDLVKWSRRDHTRFNLATRRFVVLLLWLNKSSMKFPDDVLDLLIEACM